MKSDYLKYDGRKQEPPYLYDVSVPRDTAEYCAELLRLKCESLNIAKDSNEWKQARTHWDSLRASLSRKA